jgi:hypothetical protein
LFYKTGNKGNWNSSVFQLIFNLDHKKIINIDC